MLSTGFLATPSTCLRCQLRQVILRTRIPTFPQCLSLLNQHQSRGLTASTRRYQDTEEEQQFDDQDGGGGRSNLSKYPLGRVIGKPGRRQRERSARLKTKAMAKPFDVIVMQDVTEPKEESVKSGTGVPPTSSRRSEITGAQIASEILDVRQEPSQEEVEESIVSLRPETTILDERQYNHLARTLLDSYTTQQLSQYLTNVLNLSSIAEDEVQLTREENVGRKDGLRRSQWRPGRTPLGQRHTHAGVLKKSEIGTNKGRLAQQILRLAWNLTIQSEMQQIGELEIVLEKWQTSYLFELSMGQVPMYQAMIDSPLLRRSAEIRPYWPHNIMRVTARRQDAEDIAEQIERKLQDLKSEEVKLAAFRHVLGEPGWPKRLEYLFDESILKNVEQRTTSVFERRDFKTLVIHSASDVSLHHARRVLLSTLSLPSPHTTETTDVIAASIGTEKTGLIQRPLLLPEHVGPNLHLRYRDLKLGRLSISTGAAIKRWHAEKDADRRNDEKPETEDRQEADPTLVTDAQNLTSRLSNIGPFYPVEGSTTTDRSSYWIFRRYLESQSWDVQFCKILYPAASALDMTSLSQAASQRKKDKVPSIKPLMDGSRQSVLQSQVPGVADLLSFFTPKHRQIRPPYLIAHFMPSPLTKHGVVTMKTLPRIEIRYGFPQADPFDQSDTDRGIRILGMQAILAEQELRVPLPHEAVDLRMHRNTLLPAWNTGAFEDAEIDRFTQTLERSAMQGDGALYGEPMINIRLPSWLLARHPSARRSGRPQKDFKTEYLFERFEQVQTVDFVPLHLDETAEAIDLILKNVLVRMPKNMFLRYREVEGGAVGGRRTELRLRYEPLSKLAYDRINESRKIDFGLQGTDTGQLEETTAQAEEDEEPSFPEADKIRQSDLRLVETSLGLANALTRINAGELLPLQVSRKDSED